MLELLKKMFGVKPAEQTADAPYKVEVSIANDQTQVIAAAEASATITQPAPVTSIPLVVEATPAAEVTAQNKAVAVAKAKRSPAKKAAVKKAPVPKAPRKPKTS
jgi:hypothetical protein